MKERTCYVDQFEYWTNQGRGRGEFAQYRPWLTVFDAKSHAGCDRIWSRKLRRVVHLLSQGEVNAFRLLEWRSNVVDIREQFPLDPINTQDICREMKLRHPSVRGRNVVMTTDFLVTILNADGSLRHEAIQVKDKKETLADPRTNSKLQVEWRYWQRKGIRWSVWLSSDFPQIAIRNLKVLCPFRNQLSALGESDFELMNRIARDATLSCPDLLFTQADERFAVGSFEMSLQDILKHLVARRLWTFPIRDKLITDSRLGDFTRRAGHDC